MKWVNIWYLYAESVLKAKVVLVYSIISNAGLNNSKQARINIASELQEDQNQKQNYITHKHNNTHRKAHPQIKSANRRIHEYVGATTVRGVR